MKLGIRYQTCCEWMEGRSLTESPEIIIDSVVYDSRRILNGNNVVFFALKGGLRDGHTFLKEAYEKGVRVFVVSQKCSPETFPNAHFILVQNTLTALQNLALHYRNQFTYPIIGITGSAGKTTVKEWLYHLMSPALRVLRSPKSYNSQLGVALSLLELHADCDVAIIEAGISMPHEMEQLEKMIQPTLGILTTIGRAHEENFHSHDDYLDEKLKLFVRVQDTFYPGSIHLSLARNSGIHGMLVHAEKYKKELSWIPFNDKASVTNALLAIAVSKLFLKDSKLLKERIQTLPRLALRMETFEGINGNTIINDTYNLDLDALTLSLEYQMQVSGKRDRVVIIGLDSENEDKRSKVEQIAMSFNPTHLSILGEHEQLTSHFKDSVILFKGTRKADMQRFAKQYRLKNHKTFVEINLSALLHNIVQFKQLLKPETKLLAMVKSESYGSGLLKMGTFFEQHGINYLGVAYVDEGVELRKHGIQLPILVMNAEEEGFEDCIQYQLEPAIYSFYQLDQFIKELILQGKSHYPIHLKIDTGMKRLGFELHEITRVCEIIKAQPEIHLQSVYSHLSDADNRRDKRFTAHQIQQFNQAIHILSQHITHAFDKHILNSEGVANYPEAHYDMVRIGIGMYGISSNSLFKQKLRPILRWNSSISQLKSVKKGESIGYNRSFIAEKETKIAIIPVGYADGFKRNLGNGKGGVIIHGTYCHTVGRVCMDMIMVDVTKLTLKEGDSVSIIDESKQTIEKFAENSGTIPYEILTSISKRVHRIYFEE